MRYCDLAASINDGDSKTPGWNDAAPPNTFTDWAEVDFNGSRTIGEIDVFTCQDNWQNPSEPTETMTFTLYGLTGYKLQYWNGSSWADVSGADVSGNNKVWRKFTFSPITTTKIKVLTSASLDGYSRLTEVEAWSAPATTAQIHWLVTDQLGTPRMIFDKTGSLEGVQRHDYLPFGEELSISTGLDAGNESTVGATLLGPNAGDGVRQKFTQKERDAETALDFFEARYYSGSEGRFTSPDPLLSSSHLLAPQSWNKYSYVRNNPLNRVDPSGLWDWGPSLGGGASDDDLRKNVCAKAACTEEEKKAGKRPQDEVNQIISERNQFRAAINFLHSLLNSGLLTPAERARLQSISGAYGSENDHNLVFIQPDQGGGQETLSIAGLSVVFVDFSQVGAHFNLSVVHEGEHVADYFDFFYRGGADLTQFEFEVRGFEAEGMAAKGSTNPSFPQWETQRGTPQNELLWNRSWQAADVQTLRRSGAEKRVSNTRSYGVNQQNQGPRLSNLPRLIILR